MEAKDFLFSFLLKRNFGWELISHMRALNNRLLTSEDCPKYLIEYADAIQVRAYWHMSNEFIVYEQGLKLWLQFYCNPWYCIQMRLMWPQLNYVVEMLKTLNFGHNHSHQSFVKPCLWGFLQLRHSFFMNRVVEQWLQSFQNTTFIPWYDPHPTTTLSAHLFPKFEQQSQSQVVVQ